MHLTSRERMRRAITGHPVDRPPVAYLFFGGGSHVLAKMGQGLGRVHADADLMASAQLTAAELFGHDSAMLPWGCLTVEAEALGCELEMSDHRYPRVIRRPLEGAAPRLDALATVEPGGSGRMPLVLEALTRLRRRSGDDLFIVAMVVAPFLVAAEVRGMADLLTDFALDPQFAEDLCERVTEGLEAYLAAILETGACDAVMFENAGATRELIGPTHLERFVLGYHRRLLAAARRRAPEVLLIEHNCSGRPYFNEILQLDIDAVSFAYGDVEGIRHRHNWDCPSRHALRNGCAQRFCLTPQPGDPPVARIGNVEHTRLIPTGTPDDVLREARACIRSAGSTPFVLSTGCEIPYEAPVENIRALARAARGGNVDTL